MCSKVVHGRIASRMLLAPGLVALAVMAGCGGHVQTAEEAMQKQLKANPQFHAPVPSAKFAGRVTADGQPPKEGCTLFVILNNPEHLDEARRKGPKVFAMCDADGNFTFSTNSLGDGVVPGKYVVTFAELHRPGIDVVGGRRRVRIARGQPNVFEQPDELKNLFNDPDKNANLPEFKLDLQPPGRDDYHFDLAVEGKEPVEHPGPNAVTGVRFNKE
jgi:hypothetical protein